MLELYHVFPDPAKGHLLAQAPKAYEVKEGATQNVDITWALICGSQEVFMNGKGQLSGRLSH